MRALRRLDRYPAPARLGIFLLALAILWLPLAAVFAWQLQGDPNSATIATTSWLFGAFVILTSAWGRWVRQENLWQRYGLVRAAAGGRELLTGAIAGLGATFGLFAGQGLIGWQVLQPFTAATLGRVAVEGLASALGIAVAEELLFRGWLLDECDRDYSPQIALWSNALIFATLHFLKPIEAILREAAAFPGLTILGLALVAAKRRTHGRLWLAVGLHGGLVWGYYIVAVGDLLQPVPGLPVWLTGVNSNPIASVPGWLGLGMLAVWVRRYSRGEA